MREEESSTDELRSEINDIDAQIIDLIATRVDISDELARAKKHSGQGVWDERVERRIVDDYRSLCEEVSLTPEEAEKIAHVILGISKERQQRIYDSQRAGPFRRASAGSVSVL